MHLETRRFNGSFTTGCLDASQDVENIDAALCRMAHTFLDDLLNDFVNLSSHPVFFPRLVLKLLEPGSDPELAYRV
jgi:hypothetical protein